QLELAADDPRRMPVALLNPLSEDQGVMRTTLLPGLLANVRRNINFQTTAIKLFEIGKVFFPTGKGQPQEKTRLAGVLSGNRFDSSTSPLYFKEQAVDIHDVKGVVEFIIRSMRLPTADHADAISFRIPHEEEREPFVQPGYALDMLCGETRVGSLGMIKQEVLRNYSIKNDVFYFDLDYDALCGVKNKAKIFAPLPVYPAVRRDISLVVRKEVAGGTLLAAVKGHQDKLIEDVEIFDTFTGTKIPQGYKSVSLRITYRSLTKTLTEKGVEKSHTRVVRMLTDQFGGSFRNE
ncbi:phenylalanine--tRNA ligase subunit beta, partial [candidate division KSB3 bacterium]